LDKYVRIGTFGHMKPLKRFFKRNTHNLFFKPLAGFGRSLNRMYENRNHDIFSNGELTVQKKLALFDPSVMIDGGANIGNYSLLFHKHSPACIIYAFEPVRETCDLLKENVRDHANIIPVNKGLYSENTTREINLFPSNTHSSLYDIQGLSYDPTGIQTIELVRGDDFLREQKIDKVDFIKLDLEGAEYDALLGFDEALKNKKIKAVQFEYGYINITTRHLLIDFYNLFRDSGYVVGKIFPKIVEFRDYDFKYEDFLGPNFIAVDEDEKELIERLRKK